MHTCLATADECLLIRRYGHVGYDVGAGIEREAEIVGTADAGNVRAHYQSYLMVWVSWSRYQDYIESFCDYQRVVCVWL